MRWGCDSPCVAAASAPPSTSRPRAAVRSASEISRVTDSSPRSPPASPRASIASAGPPPSRFFRVFHESEREIFESFESFLRPKDDDGLSSPGCDASELCDSLRSRGRRPKDDDGFTCGWEEAVGGR